MAPPLLRALLSELYEYVPTPFKAAKVTFEFAAITISIIACATIALNSTLKAGYTSNMNYQ